MVGVKVETPNIERIVTRITVGGRVFEQAALQDAIHETMKKGLEVARSIMVTEVYMQDSSYRDRRTYRMYHALKASRFFATGGQIYISKTALGSKKYYPKFVEKGFTHTGGKRFEGRHFWIPKTEAALRAILTVEMDKAADIGAAAMVK